MNADDFGLYRSNEFHGVSNSTVPGGNPARNNIALAAGDFNTFQSYAAIPEPSALGLATLGLVGLLRRRRTHDAH
jgi:MYXO-CTERM domain-containing protein